MGYGHLSDHRTMALDERRNAAYERALAEVVGPQSVVLDLGSGLGVHGLLAARLGAKRVYLVEPEDIGWLGPQLAKANGLGDRVELVPGKIEEIELPERVDVIVSVFAGNFLLAEDLLPSLFLARDRFLKPGGTLVPGGACMEAAPVHAPELYAREIACWSEPHLGLDLRQAREYAGHSIYYSRERLEQAEFLAGPVDLLDLDFHQASDTDCKTEAACIMQSSGLCHGWAGWFRLRLGQEWLSTSPHEPELHWSPAFLPLDPPLEVRAGEEVRFRLVRPPEGPWSWSVEWRGREQRRCTLFSRPLNSRILSRASAGRRPRLSREGEAAKLVLSRFDGSRSVGDLAASLAEDHAEVFGGPEEALRFVQRIIKAYAQR